MEKPREESQILEELATLAIEPGYVHAIAYMCNRDNSIYFRDILKPADMEPLFSRDRLIRTELTTLIGLMVKQPLDFSIPTPDVVRSYIVRTDTLMRELHDAMSFPMFAAMLDAGNAGAEPPNPWHGPGMREPIFYGSESAYAFQYRDFVPQKYGSDDDWLRTNRGFTSGQARTIAMTMCELMDERGTEFINRARRTKKEPDTWLPTFEFSIDEVASRGAIEREVVAAFFDAFLFGGDNSNFKEVGDFNLVAARPLIPTDRGTVLLFSHYAIYEAVYESPFFWMLEDKPYRPAAAKHRGDFAEQFATQRLAAVFGPKHVHTNVNLVGSKEIEGEVDVLVAYSNRLIIVQAKAKKLTLEARKGNDNQLKKDFAAAIQDSYDQAWSCANKLLAGGVQLQDAQGNEIELPGRIKEVFLVSLVSEHYPALAFQANLSLKYQTTEVIRPPLVMDVFLLDTLTEMLTSPLRLMSYLQLRVALADKLMTGHELTVLGFHLKQNLWVDEEYATVILEDSIAQDLDTAMLVRRDRLPGNPTPEGILTKMKGTCYEQLITEIETSENPGVLELGFHLLTMNEKACNNVHLLLEGIAQRTGRDRKLHDVTLLAAGAPPCGITFHCNAEITDDAIATLKFHCAKRKYHQRADKWFGISINPHGQVQFGVTMDSNWVQSDDMDRITEGMSPGVEASKALPQFLRKAKEAKPGRNDPCHCGSGRKYKKCCMP
ncbi:SEC-C metal-binding domain-containing protein [Silvimonas iriomotensis]|uniref:Prepilin peptidase n=1 Tax=Silvimonas iriomotensis TaxID=449662 RepID=A0ABQ2PA47_9NEIS|nr:prepilin peptidase [Silvimonas iriomotensis]